MGTKRRELRLETKRRILASMMMELDDRDVGTPAPDTVPTGFPSVDKLLGGGLRTGDLTVLGGDVGSGKSALALAMAVRAATLGVSVSFVSGEMDESRLLERILTIQGRARIDDFRNATVTQTTRSAVGAAALSMKDLPIRFHVLGRGADPSAVLDPAMHTKPRLLIIDYLQLLPNPHVGRRMAEADAAWVRELKAEAVHRPVACLLLAQVPDLEVSRPDPRPTLNDYGALGSVKQHADTVLHIFREEMYRNDNGLDGATELIVAKNRNGTTGFIDLYFYKQWMRFEDMLDPDR